MKKLFIVLFVVTLISAASAQTKKPAKKAAPAKKECTMEAGENCCEPASKTPEAAPVKKPAAKKG